MILRKQYFVPFFLAKLKDLPCLLFKKSILPCRFVSFLMVFGKMSLWASGRHITCNYDWGHYTRIASEPGTDHQELVWATMVCWDSKKSLRILRFFQFHISNPSSNPKVLQSLVSHLCFNVNKLWFSLWICVFQC